MAANDDRAKGASIARGSATASLEQLQTQLETLATRLEQAEAELDALRRRRERSMRDDRRCPACGSTSLLFAPRVHDQGGTQEESALALGIKGLFKRRPIGRLQCHACRRCGLVEWHVEDVASIDVQFDAPHIELIEGEPGDDGPYR